MRDDAPWATSALCRETGSDLFFPNLGDDPRPAQAICRRCPVKIECLDYALANPKLEGVWGGLTHNQRTRLRNVPRQAYPEGADKVSEIV